MSEHSAADLMENGAMSPDDFHDCIPRISEVADFDLLVSSDLDEKISREAEGLLVDPSLLRQCAAALTAGNVVLQGPPGTGKSTLARALARAFNSELTSVTAHEEWSTFEVVGRQELRVSDSGAEEIVPVNGHFTEAVIECAGKIPKHLDDERNPQATWLLIDELNRSNPDRAFGELFSVLGSDEPVRISLSHQTKGNDVLVVPRRFRIIATVNSIDSQFVNGLSQALRRRFSFLTLDIPPQRQDGEEFGSGSGLAAQEFSVVINAAIDRVTRRNLVTRAAIQDYTLSLIHISEPTRPY